MHQHSTIITTEPTYLRYSARQRWGMLAILFLVSMWNYVDRQVISVLIQPIKQEFHASDTAMGVLTGFAFAASYAVFGLPAARLADRGDRRIVITIALVIWSLLTACCGLARTFPQLALARIGVGIGEAGAIPPAQSLIADYFPPEKRTRAFAIFMSSAMVGTLIAFSIGGRVAAAHGWRAAFIVLGLPGLLIAVATMLGLHEPRSGHHAAVNGSLELVSTGLKTLASKPSFVLINVAMVLYFLVAYGAVSWFPAYLGRVLHMTLPAIGATYGPAIAIASFVGTLLGGVITDRVGAHDPRWLGWAPALGLLLALPIYEAGLLTNSTTLFITAAAFGAGALYGAVPGMFAILHSVCGSPRRAVAVAIVFFFANLLGLGLGPLITGAMSDAFTRSYGQPGLRYALMAASAMLLPAAITLWKAGSMAPLDLEN